MPTSLPTSAIIGGSLLLAVALPLVVWFLQHRRRHSLGQVQRLLARREVIQASRLLVELGQTREAINLLLGERRLAEAARIYQDTSDHARAADLFSRIGDHEAAAACFLRYGDFAEAAKSMERIHRYEKAGDLYVQARQMKQAARMYRKARQYKKAGDLLHQLGDKRRGANLLGLHHVQTGELDKAGVHFLRAGKPKQAGECFFKAGDFLRAASVFEELGDLSLAARARSQASHTVSTAEDLERAGELAAALPHYEAAGAWKKVVELHKRLQNWAALGEIMVRLGKDDMALEFFRRVGPQDDVYMEAAMSMASLLEKRGDVEEAIDKYSEILSSHGLGGTTSGALVALTALCERTNHPQGAALPQLPAAAAADPEPAPKNSADRERLIEKAEQALRGSNPKRACKLLAKVVKADPDDINALFRLSDVYCQLNDPERARSILEQAGNDYRDRGFLLKSVAAYEKLLGLDPHRWKLHGELGGLHARLGKVPEAVAEYKQQLMALLALGRPLDALHMVRRILAFSPDNLQDRIRLAEAWASQMQYQEAARDLREALSCLEERTGESARWITVAERYLYLNKHDLQVAQQLVEKLLELDRYQDALLWLTRCIDEKPGDIENLELLATCFETLGQPDKAVAILKILGGLYGSRGLGSERESIMLRILECDPKDLTANRELGRSVPKEADLERCDLELDWELPGIPEATDLPPPLSMDVEIIIE